MTIVVIPAYNEEKRIGRVIESAKKYGNVVVVDDASDDGTVKASLKAGAHVIRMNVNSGVGAATCMGMRYALRKGADIIVTIDADGQHDPKYIPRFVKAIRKINSSSPIREMPINALETEYNARGVIRDD